MNVLPLILALVLMLSVLTVEKLEKFKNQKIVQEQYQIYLKKNERHMFNKRQRNLYKEYDKTLQQVSFGYLLDKKARDKGPEEARQFRVVITELMKNVYGEAHFYKELEKQRGNFVEELLNEIEKAADRLPEDKELKSIEEIARLQLDDPELQQAFYHMLKGTVEREELENMQNSPNMTPRMKEKAYISLLKFIDKEKAPIEIQLAPKETLKAIFGSDEIVNAITTRRNEIAANKELEKSKNSDSPAAQAFANEFKGKQRPGITENILNFKISTSDKSDYD